MDKSEFFQLKNGMYANHPLMRDEGLYNDMPIEVQGLFVMEPYFPLKRFNQAFAWLFGKEHIKQIDADSFAHYEKVVNDNSCYTLGFAWEGLPFTKDEHCHIFSEFNKLYGINHGVHYKDCMTQLARHTCITAGMNSPEAKHKTIASQSIDCELPILIDAVRFLFTGKRLLDSKDAINLDSAKLTDVLYKKEWTKELLFELLEISRAQPINASNNLAQYNLRKQIVQKLCYGSIFPSLDRDDLTGPYGRAENILARVLDGDSHLLNEFDIKMIVNSPIELDYADNEVSLAASLATDPELNEWIIAERLRLRTEQLNDTPALARQRPAL